MAISTIGTNGIENGAIVAADIASGAVTQSKLATSVAGTGPAFRAYLNTSQTVSAGVTTKISLETEAFDTANCFNTSTNRFTPNVAGYYQFSVGVGVTASGGLNYNYIQLFKNGSIDSLVVYAAYGASFTSSYGALTALVYLNGSTDYVELYGNVSGSGTCTIYNGSTVTYMSGVLVRAA